MCCTSCIQTHEGTSQCYVDHTSHGRIGPPFWRWKFVIANLTHSFYILSIDTVLMECDWRSHSKLIAEFDRPWDEKMNPIAEKRVGVSHAPLGLFFEILLDSYHRYTILATTRVLEEVLSQQRWHDPFVRRDVHYIAPEVILGLEQGFSIDWWSMGIILYQMLTGLASNPFSACSTLQEYFTAIVNGKQARVGRGREGLRVFFRGGYTGSCRASKFSKSV